ncbi:hypothetical protein IFO70_35970 [Phormidium tenue FACHB-886]|nr:hypothetical protein [Phormidium tenue FACHB-886]
MPLWCGGRSSGGAEWQNNFQAQSLKMVQRCGGDDDRRGHKIHRQTSQVVAQCRSIGVTE